jgi:hypothetical protein
VKTFLPLPASTGESTAFGNPSLVMVTCLPCATTSSKADNLALATRKGIVSPTPGMATVSFKIEGAVADFDIRHFVVCFSFMTPM